MAMTRQDQIDARNLDAFDPLPAHLRPAAQPEGD